MGWDIAQVKHELSGPCALMMAFFHEDLSLNPDAVKATTRHMIEAGMGPGHGFLICPAGTGEYLSLDPGEHRQMVEAAVEAAAGRLPVVAGVAGIDIREVIAKARAAQRAGVRYVMIPPPFYDRLDQDAVYRWYAQLADALDLGLMVYDQSWRKEGTGLTLPLIERLAAIDNVVSLKYGCPAYFNDMIVALDRFSDRFAFVENSLGFTSTISFMHGGTGFISGPALWWPAYELEFHRLLQAGEFQAADRMHSRMAPYMALFSGENWGRGAGPRVYQGAEIIKASCEYVGLYGGPMRPPHAGLSADEKRHVWAILDQLGVREPVAAG